MHEQSLPAAVTFPDDFVWGCATAAYQIEGAAGQDGRTPSIWDTFAHTTGNTHHGDHGDIACDHYHRLETDLDLIATLGLDAYRFSISWSRVKPSPDGHTNSKGLSFYERVVDGLLDRGIQPFGTLYHWDMPQWLQDKGGWATRDAPEHFARFAEAVLTRLGDRVPYWITLNEPYCAAFHGHLTGRHAPGLRDEETALASTHHLLLAHAYGLERIRGISPNAQAGITLNLSDVHPASSNEDDAHAATLVDLVENRLFLSPILRGAYPEDAYTFWADVTDFKFLHDDDLQLIGQPLDLLGINYYEQHRVCHDPHNSGSPADPVRTTRKLPPTPPTTAAGVGIRPDGLYNVLIRVHNEWTELPLWITENGIALHDYIGPDGRCHDPERIDYLRAHLRAAAGAIAQGVPLRGYFAWSVMDNFEWASGYSLRYGLVYVDYATQARIPKTSASWLSETIQRNALQEPP